MTAALPRPGRRRWLLGAAALLLAVGAWQAAAGLYIPAKALAAQVLLQRAWSETLAGGTRIRPWPWADTWPVARLIAPDLGIDLIVLDGATGRTMAFGPGHLAGSAAIGDPGVAVLAAHRDTHFRFLERLGVGDRFTLQTPDGRRHVYRVQATEIADYRDAWIRQSRVGSTVALVTCYPFDAIVPGGPLRYLVHAVEVPESALGAA